MKQCKLKLKQVEKATAAAQAASGWGTEDYTPSGPPEPTVFNSSKDDEDDE
jgi:hypothetical protein